MNIGASFDLIGGERLVKNCTAFTDRRWKHVETAKITRKAPAKAKALSLIKGFRAVINYLAYKKRKRFIILTIIKSV